MRIPPFKRICTVVCCVLGFGLVPVGCKLLKLGDGSNEPKKPLTCVDDLKTVREFKVDLPGDGTTKVKALLEGVVHLREVVNKLDRDVANACAAVARDLGKDPVKVDETADPGERSQAACNEAASRVKTRREKGGVVLLLYSQPPMCTTSLSEHTSCLRQCDANLAPGGGGTSCDPDSASGRCGEKCDGVCVSSHTDECKGLCRGVCRGGCDDEFFGKCGGRCVGTCDGTSVSGKCEGQCEGKCSADADGSCQGTCKGKCAGSCLAESKKAECAGTCAGTCSEDMQSARCGSVVAPPEMVPECGALCGAKMARETSCVAGNVDVQIYNSTKKGEGEKVKAALQKGIGILLEAGEGMKAPLDRAQQGLQTGFDNAGETIDSDDKNTKQIGSCVESAKGEFEKIQEALKKVQEASASLFFAAKG